MRRRTPAAGAGPRIAPAVRALTAARAALAVSRRRRPSSPADLARRLDPKFVVTPAVQLISDELARAATTPNARTVITCPPRTGKSRLVSQVFPVWLMMRDPDTEIILKSYNDELANDHSAEARRLIAEHHDLLGVELDESKSAVGRWRLAGRKGGMLAGGIMSATTGFGADCLVLDDVVKNAQEADSPAHRRRIANEFRASLMTRLHPGAPVIAIGTRWAKDDLLGTLLEGGGWRYVNIPAVSEPGVPDSLDRAPGTAFTSATGYTSERYAAIKANEVGSREWAAMYLGVPSNPAGGVIKREWLDAHRLIAASRGPTLTVVAVDPAESGEGDQTGIVAGSLGRDGQIALTHDVSDYMTSEVWISRAVTLCEAIGASRLVVEGFSAATTYTRLLREAVEKAGLTYVTVSSWPPPGESRKGDSLSRSQGLIAALELGHCRIAGRLDNLEAEMISWDAAKHQPDSVAAATIAYETLRAAAGARIEFGVPGVGNPGKVISLAAYLGRRIG
ncbi:terminase large subunit domain-containing protein [Mycolicibacter arupensis]|jgi:hypothetical protein|uniref:Uncharacterized protein n=1 Tax=Mycolicibacter arupensis TaxID=342002 RepID=A0A5C7Y4Q8_9MYCO|nr:terminase family protein [Mycolicibacter arupensis]TXI56889.1 MAG: hypothetical protein E6Q54_09325 [Mycolicibacter arupensis]